MNRGTKFITGVIAAVLTFTTLTLTLGERKWQHRGDYWHDGHHHSGSCSVEETKDEGVKR